MKIFFQRTVPMAALIMAFILCGGCGAAESMPREEAYGDQSGEEMRRNTGQYAEGAWRSTDVAMGTVIQQTLYAPREEASAVSAECMELLEKLEGEELSWRLDGSEVYRINASAHEEGGCALPEDMALLLEQCMEISESSEGAFDITLGSLTGLWNIDRWASEGVQEVSLPSGEEVKEALSLCGSEKLKLESGPGARLFMPEGMRLDLGAVGKGVALSRLRTLLEERPEVSGAVISLGGSILTYGVKPDGSPWRVAITNPFDTAETVGILSLEGQWCVSTSGDYERYVEADGVRYHHILDPATGYPADTRVRGVSILSKDGLLSDALSTACFILGPEKGMELAGRYGAEALFVMEDGELILSEGMKRYFTKNDSYRK